MLQNYYIIEQYSLYILFYFILFLIAIIFRYIFNESLIQNKVLLIDTVNNLLIISLCIYSIIKKEESIINIAIIISLVSFISSIFLSKYLNTYGEWHEIINTIIIIFLFFYNWSYRNNIFYSQYHYIKKTIFKNTY